jgi:AmmeMemoRadiSam system protein A
VSVRPLGLDDEQRTVLLSVAEEAIRRALVDRACWTPERDAYDPVLHTHAASFVTLERDERLLGCVGTLDATAPLVEGVARQALGAAFADPRVPPIDVDDFVAMTVKISVLSEPERVPVGTFEELAAAVRVGLDGVVVEAGSRRATLLPSVWRQLHHPGEFLAALWEKAGLTPGTWPAGTRAFRYTTDEFARAGPRALTPAA